MTTLEKLDELYRGKQIGNIPKYYEDIRTELKVLNILKTKRVSLVNIYFTDEVDEYNDALGTELDLTETEYKMIKEFMERK